MRMLSPISRELAWPRHNWSSVVAGDAFEDFDRIVESFLCPIYARLFLNETVTFLFLR